jgi:8-oxo-dGTP pyrophosphatase MutT (NUDIX family)
MNDFKHKLLAVMQHIVIVNRERVLLLRYSGYQGKGDPTEDLLREVEEETGLRLAGSPRLMRNYVVPFPDGIERYGVFYLYKIRSACRPAITLSGEHTEYMWAGREHLNNIPFIGPYHRKFVEETLESININNN